MLEAVLTENESAWIGRVVAILSEEGPDLTRVEQALAALGNDLIAASDVLRVVASRQSGQEMNTLDEVASWLLSIANGASLARLLLSSPVDDRWLSAVILLLISRRLTRQKESASTIEFSDAPVEPLDRYLVKQWKRFREMSPHEWLYHPRRTAISGMVVQRFLVDLMSTSALVKSDAERGALACDLNVEFSARGRKKTLDSVLGRPSETLGNAPEPQHPLRKAKLSYPLITVEVKACMTSHRQANSRLIDELHSSVEVVKSHSRDAIPVAVVIVNVSPTFTNPLNLPGPNKHVAVEVARIFERVVQRVQLDSGTGVDTAYGGLALVVVDIDNEKRIREASRTDRVPDSHTYERMVGRVAALYERVVTRGGQR
jgi:hypothetical protein